MKILFLIESLGGGGKERRLVELLKGLHKKGGFECHVALMYDEEELYDDLKIIRPTFHHFGVRKKKSLSTFRELHAIVQKVKPDLIHSWGTMPSIFAIPSAKLTGTKLINGNITGAPEKLSLFSGGHIWDRITFLFSDMILGNSMAGIKAYRPPKHKTRCIYNGFDLNRLKDLGDPERLRKSLGIDTKFVIGMVARFWDAKDHDTYFRAAFKILEQRQDVTFLAVGDGHTMVHFQNMIPEKFQHLILFTGNRHDVDAIVNLFDIGVLATYTEGVSNAIIEYMVARKPVVATDGGGTAELLIDGTTGYLVPKINPDALARKISWLLSNPSEAKAMGEAGHERIKNHFSLERMTRDYIELYQELSPQPKSHASSNHS